MSAERLREWVIKTREKFDLPLRHPRSIVETEYWRGYEACLRDVECLAGKWEERR